MRKGDKRPGFTFKNSKGVEYEVLFYKPNKKIYIDPYQSDQGELNTAIHEFAHAFFWEKTEKEIRTFADTMSRFLYNECHWRKKGAAKKKKKK